MLLEITYLFRGFSIKLFFDVFKSYIFIAKFCSWSIWLKSQKELFELSKALSLLSIVDLVILDLLNSLRKTNAAQNSHLAKAL